MIVPRNKFFSEKEDEEAYNKAMKLFKENPRIKISDDLMKGAIRHEMRIKGKTPKKPTIIYSKESLYSRHTPKGLKKYQPNTDEEIDNMTRGQRLRALEEEDRIAASNTQKYANKKMLKYGGIGAGVGAVTGALLSPSNAKGARALSGISLGLSGAGLGAVIGDARGRRIAEKEGHNRDKRTKRLARRIDDRARMKGQDDDYEYINNTRIDSRKAKEEAESARRAANYAAYNSLGARYGF